MARLFRGFVQWSSHLLCTAASDTRRREQRHEVLSVLQRTPLGQLANDNDAGQQQSIERRTGPHAGIVPNEYSAWHVELYRERADER